jgi:hypothetical protein
MGARHLHFSATHGHVSAKSVAAQIYTLTMINREVRMDTEALAENHDRLIHEREYTHHEAHRGRRFAITPGNSGSSGPNGAELIEAGPE